eukprot:Nk52_evm39s255 gene=Nk52_evmTU39s255
MVSEDNLAITSETSPLLGERKYESQDAPDSRGRKRTFLKLSWVMLLVLLVLAWGLLSSMGGRLFDWSSSKMSGDTSMLGHSNEVLCGHGMTTENECNLIGCMWKEGNQDDKDLLIGNNGKKGYCAVKAAPVLSEYSIRRQHNGADGEFVFELSLNGYARYYEEGLQKLKLTVHPETDYRIRVKIEDFTNKRYEVPSEVFGGGVSSRQSYIPDALYDYEVSKIGEPFYFRIKRRLDGKYLFDTNPRTCRKEDSYSCRGNAFNGLIFENQYIEFSTHTQNTNKWEDPKDEDFLAGKSVPDTRFATEKSTASSSIYGFGEHVRRFKLSNNNKKYTIYNHDITTPVDVNLYGTHPYYMEIAPGESGALSHGVLLMNSNAMEMTVNPGYITYRLTGGVIDLYFLMGPDPKEVHQQYIELIGNPFMVPFWSLGYNQCRWGFKDVEHVSSVVTNFKKHQIPLETMWVDIDYMDGFKDFSYDEKTFAKEKMAAFINELHANGQKFIVILDPAIKVEKGYSPYEEALRENLFILDGTDANHNMTTVSGKELPFLGKVWPGYTHYPDFLNPKAQKWWKSQIETVIKELSVDGLWIDMNEAANFCNGGCKLDLTDPGEENKDSHLAKKTEEEELQYINDVIDSLKVGAQKYGKPPSDSVKSRSNAVKAKLRNPPFAINIDRNRMPLNTKGIETTASHFNGEVEYNVHNVYGHLEAKATRKAMDDTIGKRSMLLSRSSFVGSGKYGGHWTGDNKATWEDMALSIPGILNFNMFGIPMVGSDICGFLGNTTEELCARWMALGSFYPFSRNHNANSAIDQEPYVWSSVANISRKFLGARYSLLPFLYTQFYMAHTNAVDGIVAQPLVFNFPEDQRTHEIDTQFMLGSSVMVCPVLIEGAEEVNVYFPGATNWYDFWSSALVDTSVPAGDKPMKGKCHSSVNAEKGSYVTVSANIDELPVYIRGGSIIPFQEPHLTTDETRDSPYSLKIAFSKDGSASGSLYIDDGTSLSLEKNLYVQFFAECTMFDRQTSHNSAQKCKVLNDFTRRTFKSDSSANMLNEIVVLGVCSKPEKVTVLLETGNMTELKQEQMVYDAYTSSVKFLSLGISIDEKFILEW